MWDFKHLLSLLESWTLVSYLTNLKDAWKMTTLEALIMAKHSDFSLLYIDNQHLFLQHHAAILFQHLVVRQIDWVIFELKFILNLILELIFALFLT